MGKFLSAILRGKLLQQGETCFRRYSYRVILLNFIDSFFFIFQVQGLRMLVLNKNPKFGDNGIRQLVHALKTDFWLKSLNLKHCGITKHGGEIIIRLLQSNTSITRMDLTENQIPINSLQMIFRMLKRKRESMESTTLKKRFYWEYPRNKMFPNRTCLSSKGNGKYSMNRSVNICFLSTNL